MAFKHLLVLLFVQHAQVGSASRVTRRLSVTNVQPGVNLQTVVDNASPGDVIVLGDGTYTGSGTSADGNNMLYINKDITIRAVNPGQAVLDGENARRVVYISSGTVVIEGLDLTTIPHGLQQQLHKAATEMRGVDEDAEFEFRQLMMLSKCAEGPVKEFGKLGLTKLRYLS